MAEQYIWPVTILVMFAGMWALVWRSLGIAHDLAKSVLGNGGMPSPVTVTSKTPITLGGLLTKATTPAATPVAHSATPAAPTAVIDPALIAFVKKEEGFSAKAYGDFKQTSIGYGTKALPGETTITEADASARLLTELGAAQASVEAFCPDAPVGVKQALTDLTYNSGTIWEQQGLGTLIKAKDYTGAAARILQYNHAGGEVNAGLTARREAEAKMFTTPL